MQDSTTPTMTTTAASRWGRARFGGSFAGLALASLAVGVLLAGGVGWLFASFALTDRPGIGFAFVAAGVLPVATMLGWAIFVDRSTLAGAVERPEESIESVWYEKAASGAFGDILLVGGISAVGFSIMQIDAPVMLVVAIVIGFAMLDFGVRYLWQRSAAK